MTSANSASDTTGGDLRIPRHVAIIMDGNGRWAQSRGRPRAFGHSRGVEAVRATVQAAGDMGITQLTVFSFSTENWNRPAEEVGALFDLMGRYVRADLASLDKKGVRIRILGRRDGLNDDLLRIIEDAETRTQDNTAFQLNIAFNYGGRDEIVRATRTLGEKIRCGQLDPEVIDEDVFSQALDTHDLDDVDLLIRTSGEMRISNFLLWQAAYAEMIFMDVLWPDFDGDHLRKALEEFSSRNRRYGGLDAGAA
ncbi:isoprenyl transferase [Maricaulis sp. D1M11]|uniref:isoprenyl transferase n=1 Tax=Maricaulis sp. D1M11 TaxID=3076117 RepID=UPI0039B61642